MLPKLERHEIVFEFLDLMRKTAILPAPLRGLQGALIRAAVAITPAEVRAVVGLGRDWDLGPIEGGWCGWPGRRRTGFRSRARRRWRPACGWGCRRIISIGRSG
jgi:hypothetical protein